MKKMTSEVIAELQECVDKYGDLPFALWDNEYRSGYNNVSIDVASTENDGCSAHTIGITFCDEWETETEQEGCTGNQKVFYLTEDQFNDCYKYLGIPMKDAHDMNEAEMDEADAFLSQHFEWVEHPDCVQLVPKHIATGHLIW